MSSFLIMFVFLDFFFFFFNDTATTEIYTLSLHDALPIFVELHAMRTLEIAGRLGRDLEKVHPHRIAREIYVAAEDRKSTRLNSSHLVISYAVFCLKKKKKRIDTTRPIVDTKRHANSRQST